MREKKLYQAWQDERSPPGRGYVWGYLGSTGYGLYGRDERTSS